MANSIEEIYVHEVSRERESCKVKSDVEVVLNNDKLGFYIGRKQLEPFVCESSEVFLQQLIG